MLKISVLAYLFTRLMEMSIIHLFIYLFAYFLFHYLCIYLLVIYLLYYLFYYLCIYLLVIYLLFYLFFYFISLFLIYLFICNPWSTRWRSWLRQCATSRKVAGSIADGVVGIFSLT